MNTPNNEVSITKKSRIILGIRGKLLFGFLSIIMIFLISVIITFSIISQTLKHVDIYSAKLAVNHEVVNLQGSISEIGSILQMSLLVKDNSKSETIDYLWRKSNKIMTNITYDIAVFYDPIIYKKWNQLTKELEEYKKQTLKIMQYSLSSTQEDTIKIYKLELMPMIFSLNDLFNVDSSLVSSSAEDKGLLNLINGSLQRDMDIISRDINKIGNTLIVFFTISFFMSIIITILSSREIINPIRYAIEIARKVSSGKRDIEIDTKKNDETGELLKSLNTMNKSIILSENKLQMSASEIKSLYESIVNAATLFSKHTSSVASGDLTKRIAFETNDKQQDVMIKLGNDLNSMTGKLSAITSDIVKACSNMVATLGQVRHAVDNQSSGASEQASSINQITASITEIEKSAFQTMNKAKTLGELAEKTRQSGQLGLESIQNSVSGMKLIKDKVQTIAETILDLSKQTQQVGDITTVVNNLAQQSKMLALNASIEAAKAGEAGKGFAVVATEVKNLAEQSEHSTAEVQKILENIKISTERAVMVTEEGTKGVDVGLKIIEQTGQVIHDLNEVIREAAITSQQIEAAIRQESAAIEQITAGMGEINSVTASFVESIKLTSTAIDDLSVVSNKLKSSVDIYKIL